MTALVPELEKLRTQIDQRIEQTYAARKKVGDELAALLKRGAPVPPAQREALTRAVDKYLKTQAAFQDAAADLAVQQQEIARIERVHDQQEAVLRKRLRDTAPAAIGDYRFRLDQLYQTSELRSGNADVTRDELVRRIQATDQGIRRCDELKEIALTDEELEREFRKIETSIGVAPPPASRGL
jgi:hypothetical protein